MVVREPEDSEVLDSELRERWRAGDLRARNRLWMRYHMKVTRFFENNADDQERHDLTSETFKRLCCEETHRPTHRSFGEHVRVIAAVTLGAYYYKAYYMQLPEECEFDPEVHAIEEAGEQTPSHRISGLVDREVVIQCLRELPVEAKQLMELYYWHGRTVEELGKVFGIQAPSVRTRLYNIKRKLQTKIAEREPKPKLSTIDIEQQFETLQRLLVFGPRHIDAIQEEQRNEA